jgi:hypothetical protein
VLDPESASSRRFARYFRRPIQWRKCRQASSPSRNPPLSSAGGHSLLYESKDWPSAQLESTLASANLKMLGSTHLEPNLQGRHLGTDYCKRNLHQGYGLRVVYTAMEYYLISCQSHLQVKTDREASHTFYSSDHGGTQ